LFFRLLHQEAKTIAFQSLMFLQSIINFAELIYQLFLY
jgi:hypothetical protein